MISVSDYWKLSPARQGKIRAKIEKAEAKTVVGYYARLDWGDCTEFTLFCAECYHLQKSVLEEDYKPLTKREYLDQKHEMHGEACERCFKPLA